MKKRIFSFFLALVMLFSCLSLNVFATEEETPAPDSGTGDSLQPHTDEQLEAAIKNLNASEYGTYGFNNAAALPSSNDTKLTLDLDKGKIVFGGSSTKDSYVQLTTPSSGRASLLTSTDEYEEDNGKSFVVQVEFTAYQGFIDKNVDMNLIKLSSYACNAGYSGSIFRPKAIQTDYIICKGNSIYAYNVKTAKHDILVATYKADEPIVIALHVNPSDYDEEAGILGSYDVYANGELKRKRLSFFSEDMNDLMTMPTNRPYFTDSSFDGDGTTVKDPSGKKAYFFSDKFDVTVDADKDGVYDVYQDVPGITATSGYPTAIFIGEINGVRDYVLASARFGSTSANYGENVQAYAIDNMMLYYDDEYVGTLQEHVFAESTYIDPVKDRVEKTSACPCGTCTDPVYESLLFDVNLDEKLSAKDLESFVGEGNVLYAAPTTTEGSSQIIEVENSGEKASYVVSFDLKFTNTTKTGRVLEINDLPFLSHKENTLYHFTSSNSTAGGKLSTKLKTANDTTYNIAVHHTTDNTVHVYADGELLKSFEFYKEDLTNPTKFYFRTGGGWTFSNIQIYRSEEIHPCTLDGHSYETVHTHDYENDTTTVGYKCTKCDKTYLNEIESNDCVLCGGKAISDDVVITSRNATLGELIDMNIYANISDALVNTEGATATITCGDKTETVALNGAEKTKNGYKFSLPLRSIDMAKDVTLTIDGATYVTSIADYANQLIATDPEAAPVAKALLNYGAAAQTYFAGRNGNPDTLDDVLANAALTDADKVVPDLDDKTIAEHTFTHNGTTDAMHFTGAKLQLASKTHMKLYFTAPAGATVTVGGETSHVYYDAKEGEYYVFISDIIPAAATEGTAVVITAGGATVSKNVSAFNAVVAALSEDDTISTLMTAYGQYCLAAIAYAK